MFCRIYVCDKSGVFDLCIVLDELRAVSNQCSYVLTYLSVLHRYRTLLQRYVFYGVGWVAFTVVISWGF